jgi:hypothetical protein
MIRMIFIRHHTLVHITLDFNSCKLLTSTTRLYSRFKAYFLSNNKKYSGCFSSVDIDVCISHSEAINRCVNLIVYSIPKVIARSSRRESRTKCHGSGHLEGLFGSRYGLTNGAWLQRLATSSNGVSLTSKLSLNFFHSANLSVSYLSNTVGYIK